MKKILAVALVATVLVSWLRAASPVSLPDPAADDPLASSPGKASLVIAGGCFWGIEELYQHVRGVTDAVSGYSGGTAREANYEIVSLGTTGHAESVKVTYDPSQISVGQLLKIFFAVAHDPTQKGGQGPDMGPQYRSVIFDADERQQTLASAYIEQLTAAKTFKRSITTKVVPLTAFYEAEAYHQDYAAHHPNQPYIVINDKPKVDALKTRTSWCTRSAWRGRTRDRAEGMAAGTVLPEAATAADTGTTGAAGNRRAAPIFNEATEAMGAAATAGAAEASVAGAEAT